MFKTQTVLAFVFLYALSNSIFAKPILSLSNCTPYQINQANKTDLRHSDSLFWKIEKPGLNTSYLLGTIHSSDPRILDIPDHILLALKTSNQFALEIVLNTEAEINLHKKMFSASDHSLTQYISDDVIKRARDILIARNMPYEYINTIQPWAAYLIMNYPANSGFFLDIKLLKIANDNNKRVNSLETIEQQLSFLNILSYEEHAKILFDTVCNYQTIQNDLKNMVNFYLQEDLPNLIKETNKYSIINEPVYKKLYKKLSIDRNVNMTKNIIKQIEKDSTFIAIGGLHLVGENGVIALLKQHGYKLTPIYQ